jgi:hypothetical protein
MHSSAATAKNSPQAKSDLWVWLLLALWLFSQSLAWIHRVEHDVQINAWQTSAALSSADDAKPLGPHAGIDCEWLDHALLAGFAGAATVDAPLVHFAASSPIKSLLTLISTQAERSYLARAPPVQPHIFEGQVTG